MNEKDTNSYERAWEKLEEIYNTWSNITIEDGNEFRSPANKKEIKKSKALMREVLSLKVSEQDVLQRIKELEDVINSTAAAFPKYTGKIIRAIIFSLVFMAGLYFYLTKDTYETPEIKYNKEWFVTNKGGYLRWDAFISDKDLPEVKQKIYLKKGTQLRPIAELGTWLQVETEDGQRGLVKYTLLKGSRYVEAKKNARLYSKIGGTVKDTLEAGIKATVLERKTIKGNFGNETYLKIKTDNGSISWVNDYDFQNLIYTNIPEIEQLYYHTTNLSMLQKLVIGKPLPEFEKQYGPALSVLKVNGKKQAYFRHLIAVDQKNHYKGLFVNLDENNVVQDIEYVTSGKERTYEIFPLVKTMRNTEIQNTGRTTLYHKKSLKIHWWEKFKDMNWFTMIIGWIVNILLLITAAFLFFSIPRIIVSPLMQIFTFNNRITNGIVILINAILLLIVYYLFFVLSILIIDQWLIPAIGSVVLYFFWLFRHIKNVSYNRCPLCNVMYSALDKGATFTGRKTNVTWGTYDVYKGTTETSTTITKNYERRDKKTTETTDSYLDHRMCALCGYNWDVDRTETEEHTEQL